MSHQQLIAMRFVVNRNPSNTNTTMTILLTNALQQVTTAFSRNLISLPLLLFPPFPACLLRITTIFQQRGRALNSPCRHQVVYRHHSRRPASSVHTYPTLTSLNNGPIHSVSIRNKIDRFIRFEQ